MDNVSALLDSSRTLVEFALLSAVPANSSTKESVAVVLKTQSTTPKSMVVSAPTDTTETTMKSVTNSSSIPSTVLLANTSILTLAVLTAISLAKLVLELEYVPAAYKMAMLVILEGNVSLNGVMVSLLTKRNAMMETPSVVMDALPLAKLKMGTPALELLLFAETALPLLLLLPQTQWSLRLAPPSTKQARSQ